MLNDPNVADSAAGRKEKIRCERIFRIGGFAVFMLSPEQLGWTLQPSGVRFRPVLVRYDMRRDDDGYTVFDIWTGWTALVKGAEQIGLDIEDANDLVDLLNLMNERRKALP